MYNFIEKNKILHNEKFGFRKSNSTSHALIGHTESIKHHLDDKKSCRNIY